MGPLRNPVNDAQDMSKLLGRLGFSVIQRQNLTLTMMKQAIREFGQQLRQAGENGVGLFYFAGHGIQIAERNYLIPVDAKMTSGVASTRDIEDQSFDIGLDGAGAKIPRGPRGSLVLTGRWYCGRVRETVCGFTGKRG